MDPSCGGPLFSVVVIGYRRPQLIREAIGSVLGQTIRRSAFEMVVVTDFEDEWITRKCLELGGRHSVMDGSVGAFLAEGVRQSRGTFLCFLDDDDLFHSRKLEILEREFFRIGGIGYFHNYWTPFESDARTRSAPPPLGDIGQQCRIMDKSPRSFAEVMRKRQWITAFNLSCVSIRRELVTPFLPYLYRINAATDSFFVALGFISSYNVVFSGIPLSCYRVHASYSRPSKTSLEVYCSKIQEHSSVYIESLNVIMSMANNTKILPAIASQRLWWELRRCMFASKKRPRFEAVCEALRSQESLIKRMETLITFGMCLLRFTLLYRHVSYIRRSHVG